jgi:hypothetical protein
MTADSSNFVHRSNRDGTIDSICSRCFVTVATGLRTADLRQHELDHKCDPRLLERYQRRQKED